MATRGQFRYSWKKLYLAYRTNSTPSIPTHARVRQKKNSLENRAEHGCISYTAGWHLDYAQMTDTGSSQDYARRLKNKKPIIVKYPNYNSDGTISTKHLACRHRGTKSPSVGRRKNIRRWPSGAERSKEEGLSVVVPCCREDTGLER